MSREEERSLKKWLKQGKVGRDQHFLWRHNRAKYEDQQAAVKGQRVTHGEGKAGSFGKQPWDGPGGKRG